MKKIITFFIFVLCCYTSLHAQIITTVAGGGTAIPGDGGSATDCKLFDPMGVATDAAGNIYIAERARHRIRKINASGTITTIAGTGTAGYFGDGGPATLAKLNEPYAIVLDPGGNIYFTEQLNSCVRKISVSGIITTIAGNGTGGYSGNGGPATDVQISGPGFISLDAAGNIYIPEFDNHCIRKVNTSGIITTIAGGNGPDGPGKTGDGGPATDAKLNRPQGVVTDASGNIYIVEYGSNIVRKVSTSGIISTIAGTGVAGYSGENLPATDALVKSPLSIAIDNAGNLYIGEPHNYRVRKISTSGIISTIAGNGSNGGTGDGGPATAATFQTITGICFDASGNMLISDMGTERIRRVSGIVGLPAIEQQTSHQLSVFPNPNNGSFTIQVPSSVSTEAYLQLSDITAAVIMSARIKTNIATAISVDVPSGIYLLSVMVNGELKTEKLAVVK